MFDRIYIVVFLNLPACRRVQGGVGDQGGLQASSGISPNRWSLRVVLNHKLGHWYEWNSIPFIISTILTSFFVLSGPVLYGSVSEWIVQYKKGLRKFNNFERLLEQDPTGQIMQVRLIVSTICCIKNVRNRHTSGICFWSPVNVGQLAVECILVRLCWRYRGIRPRSWRDYVTWIPRSCASCISALCFLGSAFVIFSVGTVPSEF